MAANSQTTIVVADPVALSNNAVQISSVDPTTGQEAVLKISLTITVPVPEDGKVEVRLPKWITMDDGAPFDLPMVSDTILKKCAVHADTNPTCEIADSVTQPGDKVLIIKGFESVGPINSGEVLNIALENVRNPISLAPRSGFRVSTMDAAGNVLNVSQDLTLTMTKVFTHQSAGESSVNLSGDTAPDRPGSYICKFKTKLPIPQGGFLSLTLPKEIVLENLTDVRIFDANLFSQIVQLRAGGKPSEIVFKDAFSAYVAPGSTISFTLNYLKNATRATESFAFQTFDAEGFGIEKLDSGLNVSKQNIGRLKNVAFAPIEAQKGVYQVSNVFTLKLKLENAFDNSMRLVLEFDADAEGYQPISDAACTVKSTIVQVAEAYLCEVVSSKKQITISNLVKNAIGAGTQIEIEIAAVRVRNPASTQKSSTVYVYTANSDKVIDAGTSAAFSPTPSRLLLVRISPNSSVTSEQDVEYTFTIQPSGPIPQNACIKVKLPEEVEISDFSEIESNCNTLPVTGTPLQLGKLPEFTCSVIDSGRAIKIDKLFAFGSTSYYQAVSFTLPGLQNPRQVDVPTSSFEVSIYENEQMAYQIYTMIEDIFVTMTQANLFSRISIRSDSIVNKAVTTYKLRVEGTLNARSQDKLEVRFPKQITVQSPVGCIGSGGLLNEKLECEADTAKNIVRVTIDLPGPNADANTDRRLLYTGVQKFELSIQNVMNSVTTAPSDQFELSLISNDGHLIAKNSSSGRIANVLPFQLPVSGFYAEPENLDLGAVTDYRVVIRPETYVPGMLLEVKLPNQLSLIDQFDIDCQILFSKIDAAAIQCEYDAVRDSIIFAKALTAPEFDVSKGLVFKFGKIRNPISLLETESFGVRTFTKDGYMIDQRLEDLVVSFTCLKPCRLCAPETNNQCIACFAEDDPFTPNLSFLSEGQCVSGCPFTHRPLDTESTFPGFIHTTCVICFDPFCDKCSGPDVGQCLACGPGKEASDGICIDAAQGPDNYWLPFLVFSCLWLMLALILRLACKKKRKIAFIPLALPGVAFFSLIMALYDGVSLYSAKKASSHATMVLIFGLVLPFILKFGFLAFMQLRLTGDDLFQDYRRLYKASTFALVISSFAIDLRLFKLIYCNVADRFDLRTLREIDARRGWWPKRLYMLLSLMMVPSDFALACIATTLLGWPEADTRLTKVAVERIIISLILMSMTVLEYFWPRRKTTITVAPKYLDANVSQKYLVFASSIVIQQETDPVPGRVFDMPERRLERTESAERDQEKEQELFRFLKKPLAEDLKMKREQMFISGLHEDGYFSDPCHLGGDIERRKLKKVAPYLGDEKFVAPVVDEIQFSSKKSFVRLSDTSWEEAMGITPADYDAQNWLANLTMKGFTIHTLSHDDNNDVEPYALEASLKSASFASEIETSSVEVFKTPPAEEIYKPPQWWKPKLITKPMGPRNPWRPGGIMPPNTHKKKASYQPNLPLPRLPLKIVATTENSPSPSPERDTPRSQRLRSTQQSNMHINEKRSGSVTRYGSIKGQGGPLINQLVFGARSSSVANVSAGSSQVQSQLQSQMQKESIEARAIAHINNRIGRGDAFKKRKPSNKLFLSSFRQRRFTITDWLTPGVNKLNETPQIKDEPAHESGSSADSNRDYNTSNQIKEFNTIQQPP